MGNVFQRELKAYLKSVSGYLFGAVVLAVLGLYTVHNNLGGTFGIANFESAIASGAWILLLAVPFLSLKMHARIHADRFLSPENLSEDGLSVRSEPVLTKGFRNMQILRPSEQDLSDSLFYRKSLLDGSLAPWQLSLGRALALAAVWALPVLLMHLYPLLMVPFGEVYLPSAYAATWAFFGLGLVLLMVALLVTTTQPHPLLSLLYLLLAEALIYYLPMLALWAHSAYAAMLFFTLVIVLIAMAVYLLYQNVTAALLSAAVLEILQLIFFLTTRSRFEGLAVRVMMLLSPITRFMNFTGGLLDIPALLYFLLGSIVLGILVSQQIRQQTTRYQADVDAAKAAAAAKGKNKFVGVKTSKLTEQQEDEAKAAKRKAVDLAAIRQLAIPAAAIAVVLLILLSLRLTRVSLIKDVSSTGLFTENERFEAILDNLSEDVTVYWICQNGAEDGSLQSALYYYSRQNPHFIVQKLEPLSNVVFLQQYIVESISNDALLLESGGRTRYLPREELYGNDYSRYEETGTFDLSFHLENMLGHALSYVTGYDGATELPTLYEIIGHGETALNDYWNVMIQKLDLGIASCEISSLPSNATMVLMANPQTDLSEAETAALASYLAGGGQLFLITGPEQENVQLPRLKALLADYGMTAVPGIIIESADHAYASDSPYQFRPRMLVNKINEEAGYSGVQVLLSEVHGITLSGTSVGSDGTDSGNTASGSGSAGAAAAGSVPTTTPLLLTSEESFSKIKGYNLTTYEKENGDIDGPFTIAALSQLGKGKIVWIGTASILDENGNTIAEGANRYFINGVLRFFGADDTWEAIPYTRYNYDLLFLTETVSSRLSLVFVGVIPVFYLLIGCIFWALKKRRQMILQQEAQEAARAAEEAARKREEEEAEAKREAYRKARREAALRAKEERKKKEQRE